MEEYRRIWGRRIRAHREAIGMSQRKLSIALGIDQGMISRWEHGHSAPRDENRIQLAAILGVTPDELFSYEPDPPNGDEQAA